MANLVGHNPKACFYTWHLGRFVGCNSQAQINNNLCHCFHPIKQLTLAMHTNSYFTICQPLISTSSCQSAMLSLGQEHNIFKRWHQSSRVQKCDFTICSKINIHRKLRDPSVSLQGRFYPALASTILVLFPFFFLLSICGSKIGGGFECSQRSPSPWHRDS